MGVVYRARHGDEVAAVKVVRPGLLDDPQVAARFEREADVLRSVHDTHISRFLDADIAGTPAWLATEYVAGPNLRDAVNIWGPLPVARWWELARGLAQALAVLEIHGIMHRDIKPANVIMSDRGPVLIDFGIAHPEDATSLTATGIVTGSPSWLSPEQVALLDLTAASDVFSLGSLLAFAATGRPPFGQGATVAVLMNIQRNAPDLEGIDATRRVLLERMLAKDPAGRPSAREVLDVARGMKEHDDATVQVARSHTTQPIAAPPAAQPRKRSWGRLAAVLTAGVLALGLGYAGFSALEGDTPSPQPTISAPAQESQVPDAPAFPGSNQLSSGDWLLSRYSISQDGGRLVIEGTAVNNGDAAASTTLTAFYYINGKAVAVASGETGEVPAGGSTQVTLTSEDAWQPGDPVLVVQAG
jgi:serine/threonine protein kinase